MQQLRVRENLSEIIQYDVPAFPVKTGIDELSRYPNQSTICHWHNEWECLIMLQGTMTSFVNDHLYSLSEGQGIVINGNRLHYSFAGDCENAKYLVLLINPSIIGTPPVIDENYIRPFLLDPQRDAIMLRGKETWEKDAIAQIAAIHKLSCERHPLYEMEISEKFTSLWRNIFLHTEKEGETALRKNPDSFMLKDMIGFIQAHYAEDISLDDIAAAGKVCRSKCCQLFKKSLHQTPGQYLCHYRISKSTTLVSGTDLSMIAISEMCGFHGASYFAETFRKVIGVSPRDFREQNEADSRASL